MKKLEEIIISAINEIRKNFYDKGNWNRTEEELLELSETLKSAQCSIDVLSGWNLWKSGKKEAAYELWHRVAFNSYTDELEVLSAMCGMMLYQAESGNKTFALIIMEDIKERISSLEGSSIRLTVSMNSVGIALAKLKMTMEAETILKEAMLLNEKIINTGGPEKADAIHQRSKNGYNLVSLILIPHGRNEEAFALLVNKVIPGYREIGADTDLAAAYYRASLASTDEKTALNYLILSAEIWYFHKKDDPKRWEDAIENIKKELEKNLQEKEVDAKINEIIKNIEKNNCL